MLQQAAYSIYCAVCRALVFHSECSQNRSVVHPNITVLIKHGYVHTWNRSIAKSTSCLRLCLHGCQELSRKRHISSFIGFSGVVSVVLPANNMSLCLTCTLCMFLVRKSQWSLLRGCTSCFISCCIAQNNVWHLKDEN